jgi:hypothetical protein
MVGAHPFRGMRIAKIPDVDKRIGLQRCGSNEFCRLHRVRDTSAAVICLISPSQDPMPQR